MPKNGQIPKKSRTMTTIQVKIARSFINSPKCRSKRLSQMNEEISRWVEKERYVSTARERDFCHKMQQMFLKRYQWYIKYD